MYEHGLIPSDYTERPLYQTENSIERRHELSFCNEIIDDMLQMPVEPGATYTAQALASGVEVVRTFNYNHPVHQEDTELKIIYQRSARDQSEAYEVIVDTSIRTLASSAAATSSHYLLHKNADCITTACLRTIDLEHGGMYDERDMTLYDVECLFNELAECRMVTRQNKVNE